MQEAAVETKTTRLAYGLNELSEACGVSLDTLHRAKKSGALRTIHIAGRVLVTAAEVQRVLREGLEIGRRGRPRKQRPDPAGANAETE